MTRPISFYRRSRRNKVENLSLLKDWILKTVSAEGFEIDKIDIIICSDEELLRINEEYLNHNYYTDIITFDYCKEGVLCGELFISEDRVKENAQEFEVSFQHEFCRVMIHGILHLIGYKDKSKNEQARMREKERTYLNMLEKFSNFVPRETRK